MTPDFKTPLAIFPLADLVFFPGTVLPLRLFEPRYRKMALDLLNGQGLLAVALLEEGGQESEDQEPAIHSIVTVGRARRWERTEEGHVHLELEGLLRARVLQEIPGQPYRQGLLEPLEEKEVSAADTAELGQKLLWGLQRLVGAEPTRPDEITFESSASLGRFCDALAALLPLPTSEKVALLGELDPAARTRALLEHLEALQRRGTLRRIVHVLPGFSLN